MATSVDNLASELAEAMAEFQDDVMNKVKVSVRKAARECVKQLKSTSPKRTGVYAKGWRSKTAYDGRYDIRVTVFNEDAYQLTHLLEHGHANAKGGGRTTAHPHIAPAEERAAEILGEDIKISLRG